MARLYAVAYKDEVGHRIGFYRTVSNSHAIVACQKENPGCKWLAVMRVPEEHEVSKVQ